MFCTLTIIYKCVYNAHNVLFAVLTRFISHALKYAPLCQKFIIHANLSASHGFCLHLSRCVCVVVHHFENPNILEHFVKSVRNQSEILRKSEINFSTPKYYPMGYQNYCIIFCKKNILLKIR